MAAFPLPPPGLTYIVVIAPPLKVLMVGTVWATSLVPLLILLFFLSNSRIRRQPIFLMNVFSVITGIVIGIASMKVYVCADHHNIRQLKKSVLTFSCQITYILSPGGNFPARTMLVYLGMILLLPVFIHCILAFRLYAVYPARTTSKNDLIIIFTPIIMFKIIRISNFIVFMVKFGEVLLQPDANSATMDFQILWHTAPWTKIEWILQVFDNWYVTWDIHRVSSRPITYIYSYASALFLRKLWLGHRMARSLAATNPRGKYSSHCV
jgi:hypothetical protein